jgi:ankyrin repeat protein
MAGKSDLHRVFTDQQQIEILAAIGRKNYNQADLLLAKVRVDEAGGHGETLLWWQVNIGDFDGFSYLLSKGANLMRQVSDGPNVLELCAMQEDKRFIVEVVKRGVNLNVIGEFSRETPIFAAVLNRQLENVMYLVRNGAYLDVGDGMGTTPALLAADQRAYDILVWLLENGANPHLKNQQGYDVLRSLSERKVRSGQAGYAEFEAAIQCAASH